MWSQRLLTALVLGIVVVASVGCHVTTKKTDPNPKPLFTHADIRQTDLVRPVIHTSRDSQ